MKSCLMSLILGGLFLYGNFSYGFTCWTVGAKIKIYSYDPGDSGNPSYHLQAGNNKVQKLENKKHSSYTANVDKEDFSETDKNQYRGIALSHQYYVFSRDESVDEKEQVDVKLQLNELLTISKRGSLRRTDAGSLVEVNDKKYVASCID